MIEKDEPILRLTEKALERLTSRLRKSWEKGASEHRADKEFEVSIGMAAAFPPATGRSSETVIYRMLLDAMEQSAYNMSPGIDRSEAVLESNLEMAG
ncbi:hypothetical protein [Paenibacillus sp. Soil522]|uniref:hypothetical protein n=1 Tax=Paenibacillus sp. Soil522 TaxID=1736388 RepID=UPI0006F59294|nr:hypothetical protein [Paenibacillus sp. Soil522]KRE43253.1 hypothetical protein ASG81_15890 [Paenibacillus sp. Soil522]